MLSTSNCSTPMPKRLMLGRSPEKQQAADVLAFLHNYEITLPAGSKPDARKLESWTAICHTLLASAEFRYVY